MCIYIVTVLGHGLDGVPSDYNGSGLKLVIGNKSQNEVLRYLCRATTECGVCGSECAPASPCAAYPALPSRAFIFLSSGHNSQDVLQANCGLNVKL